MPSASGTSRLIPREKGLIFEEQSKIG